MKTRLFLLLSTSIAAFSLPIAVVAEDSKISTNPSFFADRRAYETGDMLTVVITEIASVTAQARTETQKNESATARFRQLDEELQQLSAGFDRQFVGGGQIQRSGRLLATLAVTVSDINDNGNLVITGEQEIVLNNEIQRIRLDGVVRPEDISPDNTIASTRVSGARIELTGYGVLARRQAPGLFSRILAFFGG